MMEDETDGTRSMDVDGVTRKTLCQHVECPNRIILHPASSGLSGCPFESCSGLSRPHHLWRKPELPFCVQSQFALFNRSFISIPHFDKCHKVW